MYSKTNIHNYGIQEKLGGINMIKASIMALATIAAGTTAVIPQDYTAVNQNNNYVIVKPVQNLNELQGILSELGVSFGNNCPNWNIPNIPDINFPENNPDDNIPEIPGEDIPETEQPEEDNKGTVAQQVLDLVNEERAKVGAAPLKMNTKAVNAADIRAKEIVNSFSHTRPNGSSFTTALTESGVTFRTAGENIAWGQKTPQEVMNAWMNSQGHKANILNTAFTEIGIGVYQAPSGTMYWTQLFLQ